eukprot:49664-Chlamydomonas_euryale.AAC.1
MPTIPCLHAGTNLALRGFLCGRQVDCCGHRVRVHQAEREGASAGEVWAERSGGGGCLLCLHVCRRGVGREKRG